MAVATKLSCALIVLLLYCQYSVSSPAPDPRNMWISMQAAFGFDDSSQDKVEGSNQEQVADLSQNAENGNPIEIPSTATISTTEDLSTTTISTTEIPPTTISSTTTDISTTTTEVASTELAPTTTAISTGRCKPINESGTSGATRTYNDFLLNSSSIELLSLAKYFCTKKVESETDCLEFASAGDYGSYVFSKSTGECTVSSYWRPNHMVPVSDDVVAQAVYFMERNDGNKCFAPNLKLMKNYGVLILGDKILEELKAIDDPIKTKCSRGIYVCNNGKLEQIQIPEPFTYVAPLDKCLFSSSMSMDMESEFDSLRSTCMTRYGKIFDIENEDEQAKFFDWSGKRTEDSEYYFDLAIDAHYDPEDKNFKWREKKIPVDEKFWAKNFPTQNSEQERCVVVSKEGMKNVPCYQPFYRFCLLEPQQI